VILAAAFLPLTLATYVHPTPRRSCASFAPPGIFFANLFRRLYGKSTLPSPSSLRSPRRIGLRRSQPTRPVRWFLKVAPSAWTTLMASLFRRADTDPHGLRRVPACDNRPLRCRLSPPPANKTNASRRSRRTGLRFCSAFRGTGPSGPQFLNGRLRVNFHGAKPYTPYSSNSLRLVTSSHVTIGHRTAFRS